jgi:hypothetical protein
VRHSRCVTFSTTATQSPRLAYFDVKVALGLLGSTERSKSPSFLQLTDRTTKEVDLGSC